MIQGAEFPAMDREPVTERHVRICAERGHAAHVVDGITDPRCPRCGELRPHSARCLGAAMVQAVENLRDYAISERGLGLDDGVAGANLAELVKEFPIVETALGYFDGLLDCSCGARGASDEVDDVCRCGHDDCGAC